MDLMKIRTDTYTFMTCADSYTPTVRQSCFLAETRSSSSAVPALCILENTTGLLVHLLYSAFDWYNANEENNINWTRHLPIASSSCVILSTKFFKSHCLNPRKVAFRVCFLLWAVSLWCRVKRWLCFYTGSTEFLGSGRTFRSYPVLIGCRHGCM